MLINQWAQQQQPLTAALTYKRVLLALIVILFVVFFSFSILNLKTIWVDVTGPGQWILHSDNRFSISIAFKTCDRNKENKTKKKKTIGFQIIVQKPFKTPPKKKKTRTKSLWLLDKHVFIQKFIEQEIKVKVFFKEVN